MYLQLQTKPADRIAVIEDNGNEYTYGEICDFVQEFRGWIPDRTLIFLFCENTMGTIAAHIAAVENHIVPMMISRNMDAELRNTLIEKYGPEYLWMPKDMSAQFDYDILAEKYGYVLMKTQYSAPAMYPELSMLLTTSGSTGSPKLVRHSYRNLESNAANVSAIFQFTEEDRPLIDLQLHYTMGLNVACSSLYAGACLIMTTYNVIQQEYWRYIKEQQVTCITGVPYTYAMFKRLRFFKMDLPFLRIIAQGGGKLSDEMFKECAEYAARTGKKFYATFGTSETTARLAYLEPEMALEKIGSIGKTIPNGELFLVDEDGEVVKEQSASGELAYKGPNVTLGYAISREELQKGDEREGVYYTGDLAERDEDGFYYIRGRKSRFLKLFGYRVGLDECERLISQNLDIECACAGNDDRMHIYVTQEGLEDKIKGFIAEKTKIARSAFAVKVIDEIPKNEVGKVMYNKLQN